MRKAILPVFCVTHVIITLATIGIFTGVIIKATTSGAPDTDVLYLTGLGVVVSFVTLLTLVMSVTIWALDSAEQ